jgi:hypothetical protein
MGHRFVTHVEIHALKEKGSENTSLCSNKYLTILGLHNEVLFFISVENVQNSGFNYTKIAVESRMFGKIKVLSYFSNRTCV